MRSAPARSPVRLPRRPGLVVAWVLWLLIALLPLRALSQVLMDPVTAAPSAQERPCHGAGMSATDHDHDDAGGADAADSTDGDPSACAACDLCHAALAGPVVTAPDPVLPHKLQRSSAPRAPQAAVPGEAIFKPPRG